MISIEVVRDRPEAVAAAIERRGEKAPIARILEFDARRRAIVAEADALRARGNDVSRLLGRSRERPPALLEEMRQLRDRVRALEQETREVESQVEALLLSLPNIPRDDVPSGSDATGNVVVRSAGEAAPLAFAALPHWELGERLGIIDFERGAKLARSRFFVLKGKGARLQRALIDWMLDVHVTQHGYTELYLPALVNSETATGSGHLPRFADTMYHVEAEDLWLIPTAEVPITNLFRDEILAPGSLPLRFVGHTPCFRSEKAAAGRDTRGIKRVHQFEKVEMYRFEAPEASDDALEAMVRDAEDICAGLGLPYRVVKLCAGELGFASVRSYDLEMWAPGSNEWLEVSSCSNCTDFQSRRARIRYRESEGGRARYVHTLNGSGLALPRVVIAVLENFQQADGSVVIPEVLRPYTRFDRIEARGAG